MNGGGPPAAKIAPGKLASLLLMQRLYRVENVDVPTVSAVGVEDRVWQSGLILVRPVTRHRQVELVGSVPQRLGAHARHAGAAIIVRCRVAGLRIGGLRIDYEWRLAKGRVGRIRNDLLPPGLVLRRDADAGEQHVLDDRQVGRERHIAAVVTAAGSLGDETGFVARCMCHDADRAADGVGAEQGALRALENLDSVHVQQVLVRADGASEKHAVEIHADAGVEVEREVVLPDAANGGGQHRVVARKRRAGVEVDARREIAERVDVREVRAASASAVKAVTAIGTFCMFSDAPFCGHDDFLERVLSRRICAEHYQTYAERSAAQVCAAVNRC